MGHYAKRFFGQNTFLKSNKLSLDAGNVLSYPGTGTTWYDLSGSGNNGTLVNGVAYSTANGGVMRFDGVNDYINCGNLFNFTSGPFTISLMVKPNSLAGAGGVQGGILFWKGNYKEKGYYAQISNGTGSVLFLSNQSGANQNTESITGVVSINNWTNLCFARNGASVRIYANGIDVTNIAGNHINPSTSTNNFIIGAYGTQFNFNGYQNNIDIYDYAFTPTQAADNFNILRSKYGI